MHINRKGWKVIYQTTASGQICGRSVYVSELQIEFYNNLKKSKIHSMQKLFKSLSSLNSLPTSGQDVSSGGKWKVLQNKDFNIEYFLDNGDVLIRKIHLTSGEPNDINVAGIYPVTLNTKNRWTIDTKNSVASTPNFKHVWRNDSTTRKSAHYAAVAGKFESSGTAAQRLITHIQKGFEKEISNIELTKKNNHYSLFWINPGEHGKAKTAQSMADMLTFTAKANGAVNWLVHGEGATTFQKGLNLIAASGNAGQLKEGLKNQSVFFSNPTTFKPQNLEALCEKVGLHYEGSHISNRNLKNMKTMSSAIKTIGKITAASVAAATPVAAVGKEIGASALMTQATKTAESISSALDPSITSVGVATAAVVSLGYGVHAAYTKMKSSALAIQSIAHTTFGKGNQYWFDKDDELFEQMNG